MERSRQRAAVHLDADAFFVGCEVAAESRLRGKAVAVGGMRRGIIASASYEARRMGVYTPMPTARALKICPGLIVLPGDYEKYERFSRLMFSLAHDYTPLVEVGSIDEGYCDLSGLTRWTPREAAERLRHNIRSHLRLSVSHGLGSNKLVAAVASKLRKPDCFLEVPAGTERAFLAPLEVKWLPGVGPKMEQILRAAGLRFIREVADAQTESLELLAGSHARALKDFALGRDDRPIVAEVAEAQSYGKQETFDEDTTNEEFVRGRLRVMADVLMSKVRADGKMVRCVEVRLRYNDMEQSRRSESLGEPTDLETDIYSVVDRLAKRAWDRRVSLRLVALKLSRIYGAVFYQSSLDLPGTGYDKETRRKLARVMDETREKYGCSAVIRAHQLETKNEEGRRKKGNLPAGCNSFTRARFASHPRTILNVKSCFSFLDSLLRPQDVVRLAAESGMRAVAIADPNLHGAVEFCRAAKEIGIKPVVGAEVKIAGIPYLAYAENTLGYRNLCALLSGKATGDTQGLIVRPRSAFPEIRYASACDARFYEVVQSIRTRTLAGQSHRSKRRGNFHWPGRTEQGALGENASWRDAEEIAERCDFTLPDGGLKFPRFAPTDGSAPREFLGRLAREGMVTRYGCPPPAAVRHQIEEELRLIAEVGYEEYFLVVWDLLQGCRSRGIDWITRGSAADSLVCYCLGISDVCPVRFELYFRRFLNRERMALQKLPDIDVDFPHDRRDEVADMIFARYGPDHAAVVGGLSTYQGRSAFADIAKALGASEFQVRRMTEKLPASAAHHAEEAAHESLECRGETWGENPYRAALRLAARLDGFPRHAKMHPCGVVISRQPVAELTPIFESASGRPTTQLDMEACEAMGLVKLDILAQGGLSVLRDARAALRRRGVNPPAPGSWDDAAVWQMVARGEARGTHHIESPAMTSLARMSGVRAIDQLVAIVSVIRPGAANSLRKEMFARRARGDEPVSYAHPCLEPVLRSTYGVVAYEEHVLQICEVFAGWDAGRADMLRRALVKDRQADARKWKEEFSVAARAKGRHEKEIHAVWDLLMQFRGYAFCRAHSTAYALEAYEAAQLKRYWPCEFLAAVLTHGKGFYTRFFYTVEARRLGLGFHSPSVNGPVYEFVAGRNKNITVPLAQVKGLSAGLLGRIVKEQPFASLPDFLRRCSPGREETASLVRVGAFDIFGCTRTAQFWESRSAALWPPGQGLPLAVPHTRLPGLRTEPSALERLKDEMELLGFPVSGHPVDLFPDVSWGTYCSLSEVPIHAGARVTACGIVIAERLHRQSDGRPMKFISICDRRGILECEIFAGAYRACGPVLAGNLVVEVTGLVHPLGHGEGCVLRVEVVRPPRIINPLSGDRLRASRTTGTSAPLAG